MQAPVIPSHRSAFAVVLPLLAASGTSLLAACGGAAAPESGSRAEAVSSGGEAYGWGGAVPTAAPAPPSAPQDAGGDMASVEESVARARYAQAAPEPAPAGPAGTPSSGRTTPTQASDARETSGPLLIYTAELHLAVFEVEPKQEMLVALANEVGGFLAQRDDTTVVLRVPAARFQETLQKIEQSGDVLHRQVSAVDIGEEFRDLEIRIRNAEAMRDRLEALLRQANTVEAALQVERELERVTLSIETMKGRLRFLANRVAYSTITVRFQPRPRETLDPDIFRLPFPWLDELGLRSLLNLGSSQ